MRCPYCGGKDTVLSGDKCFACGKVLLKQEECTQPPFTKYELPRSYLSLGENSVHLSAKHPNVPRVEVVIEYENLYDVSYMPGTWLMRGFLCLRDKEHRDKLLPQSYGDTRPSDTHISFEKEHNEAFYKAFMFLKKIAEENSKNQ